LQTATVAESPPPPWRAGIDAERRHRPRRITNQRETLRRLTATVAVAAGALNAALFIETAVAQVGAGEVDRAIIGVVSSLFPGSVRPPNEPPVVAPTPPIAVTGAS
jgi:hypothetical protein